MPIHPCSRPALICSSTPTAAMASSKWPQLAAPRRGDRPQDLGARHGDHRTGASFQSSPGLVLGLIAVYERKTSRDTCGRRTAGKSGRLTPSRSKHRAGDNMIKMVHQRLAERLQGFIPQQTDQLLVIVATAAPVAGGARGGNH